MIGSEVPIFHLGEFSEGVRYATVLAQEYGRVADGVGAEAGAGGVDRTIELATRVTASGADAMLVRVQSKR